ncbi:MAG: hypothetical protein WBG71_07735 [Leeuwenhoekiella sp.]
MKVLYRLGYYLGGFAIGLILLAFFLKGSDTSIPSCSYMPNARVLKNIRSKGYSISPKAKQQLQLLKLDTSDVNRILREGEVNFSKSEQRKKPCGMFLIESEVNQSPIYIRLINCKRAVTVEEVGVQ